MEKRGLSTLGIILIIIGTIILIAAIAWVIVNITWSSTSQEFNDAQDQARQGAEDFKSGNPNPQFALHLIRFSKTYKS
ncbi:MAG: hypothetical protein ABH864_04800 [archaeon]